MDNLEEYIRKNREGLDRLQPSPANWRKISRALHGGRIYLSRWIAIAAMVAIILGSTVILMIPYIRSDSNRTSAGGETGMATVSTQLRETEMYYNNLANSLYREATPMLSKYPEIEKELFSDISFIDSLCGEIRKDLKDNVANQDVIEALVQNYRIKIKILEDMLAVLKENEDTLKKDDYNEL